MALIIAAGIMAGATGTAQEEETGDRTLSPYFFVKSEDPEVDRLPLKSTSAAVSISGVIADVQVTQVYKNAGKRPLEAIYVFPGSTRAAVYAMKMSIGERVINAKIKKREEARQEYEQAKQQGKSASLLEQQRPNVFQMNIANIMPNDEIKVEMSYTELLVPVDRMYEFIYPTVVGPRYSNQRTESAPPSEQWVHNPYLHEGEAPMYAFDISVALHAGLPIRQLISPSHKVAITYNAKSRAQVSLDQSEASGGNRDFILKYQLAGDQVESGLLLSKVGKENFFLLMLQPPKRVTLAEVPPREYIFIVDVSGSMHGFPLDISKKLLKDLIGNLRQSDLFNVVLFAGGSSVLSEQSLPATQENITRAINIIDQQRGGGGTELLPALERALKLPGPENFSRTIVIATDGYVTVEEQVFDLIRSNLGNANMFVFGIGSSVNRHLIEGMAHVGMGEPFVITKPDQAPAKAEAFRSLIKSPVLTNVKVEFKGFEVYDVEPKSIPDILADRPVIVFGKWRGEPCGKIVVSGMGGDRQYEETIDPDKAGPAKGNSALQYLWARHRIMLLSDYNMLRKTDERVKEVTNLGLTYNLLTAFTSFVAVDSEKRNAEGKQTTVHQPLPLPEGISDYALGAGQGYAMRGSARKPFAHTEEGALYLANKAEGPASPKAKSAAHETAPEKTTIEDLLVTGGLSREEARKAIEQQTATLVGCGTKKPFRLELIVNPDGTIQSMKVLSGAPGNKLQKCIIDTISKWKFPKNAGKSTRITVKLKLGSL